MDEKSKVLSDLYAIRASMSLALENENALQHEEDVVEGEQTQIENRNRQIKVFREESQSKLRRYSISQQREILRTELADCRNSLDYNRDWMHVYERWSKHYTPSFYEFKRWAIFLIILGIACVICALVGGLAFRWGLYETMGDWHNIAIMVSILIVPIIVFVIAFVTTALHRKKYYAKQVSHYKLGVEKYRADEERLTNLLNELEARERSGETHIASSDVDMERALLHKKVERQIQLIEQAKSEMAMHEQNIALLSQKSQAIVECAKEAYPIIDYRDWKNVDLLIYYVETGRADSMKEALQLVDRQRQTDQIVDAISMATRQIASSLDSSLSALGSSLAHAFERLSEQFSMQHTAILQKMNEQSAHLSELNEQSKQTNAHLLEQMKLQLSGQQMMDALLANIDRSTSDLARDMDSFMRTR